MNKMQNEESTNEKMNKNTEGVTFTLVPNQVENKWRFEWSVLECMGSEMVIVAFDSTLRQTRWMWIEVGGRGEKGMNEKCTKKWWGE